MRNAGFVGTRWLGVGLAAALAVVTISLAVTDRLALYINPDSTWFAVSMAVLVLVGAVASFALPLGAEADHGHDHGDGSAEARDVSTRFARSTTGVEGGAEHVSSHFARSTTGVEGGAGGVSSRSARSTGSPVVERARNERDETLEPAHDHDPGAEAGGVSSRSARSTGSPVVERARNERDETPEPTPDPGEAHHDTAHDQHAHRSHPLGVAATVLGGVAASGVVVLTLVLPPASLSAELAMSRDVGATPLFGGADTVQLASTGDTASFGVGDWATVFATATNPDAFDGDTVELTGFVTPGDDGAFDLTRLIITHCVIDAQPASLPIVGAAPSPDTGQWVTITGTVRSSSDGRLVVDAADVAEIAEPEDPYEY
ncbi:TIGR03943 family putative permease subunit [Microbacterium sp. ZW CA_36]|uniref:TIGR03943 family putative permease subunit n=1 Tax=Microbacterium sp. ZW CA_36 TaxID=3378078 RepID=UPI003853DBFD